MAESIDWDDLRYLEALCRLGSAAAAARELGVSASTVYRRIGALEEALGARCIVRGEAESQPTELGRNLVLLSGHMRSEVARLVASADDANSMRGTVGLTTTEGFLPLLLQPLTELMEREPELEVELRLEDFGPSVRRHEIDVSITMVPNPPPGLIGRRLRPIEYGVFGMPEAVAAEPRRWVVTGAPRDYLTLAAWEREHAESVATRSNSRSATLAFIRAGVGIGLVPRALAALHPELVEVEGFRESASALAHPVWLLFHADRRENRRVRALIDILVGALG